MSNIPHLSEAIQRTLSTVAEACAHESGYTQRRSKLSGQLFVQTLVFGWLKDSQATLEKLSQMASVLGVSVTPQGLDQRFSERGAACLEQVLGAAVSEVITSEPVAIPLLKRFEVVALTDSSVIALPQELKERWQGCGGKGTQGSAAIKLQLRLDLCGGIYGPLLEPGRSQDKGSPIQHSVVPKGALRIADLGYYSLKVFEELDTQGVFFLSRLQAQAVVLDEEGERLELVTALRESAPELELRVMLGAKHKLLVRLLASKVPQEVAEQRRRRLRVEARKKGQTVSAARLALCDWTILITNAPAQLLSLKEALVLARARWQIEMLFKLWKQHGRIDEWRSQKPYRILCELYAKLLAMLIQHWVFLVSCWSYPDRSLVKASQTVSAHAIVMAMSMAGHVELAWVMDQIGRCLSTGCRMNRRSKHPNTYQLLMELRDVA